MVTDTPYGMYPQGLPPQGGLLDDGAAAVETRRWEVVLPTPGRGYVRVGHGDDQELHHLLSEHNFPVYYKLSNIGSV